VQWDYITEYNSFTASTSGGCCGFAIPSVLRNTQKSFSVFAHLTEVTTGSLSSAAAAAAAAAASLCDFALSFGYRRLEGKFGLHFEVQLSKKENFLDC
jgi:hypothetical protein